MDATKATAEARFEALKSDRAQFLRRALAAAKLTIPSLLVEDGKEGSKLHETARGLGARGVNHLTNKLLNTLFPPNTPFFRFLIDQMVLKKEKRKDLKTELDNALSEYEQALMTDIEGSADRTIFEEALKHLVVTGNVLLAIFKGGTRAFNLKRFVVARDPMGNAFEIVVHEQVSPDTLDDAFLDRIKSNQDYKQKSRNGKALDIYHHAVLKEGTWTVYQEVMGEKIPGTEATYPVDGCPYIPLRLKRVDGEDYGRGVVEELEGDLDDHAKLTKAIVDGARAAARGLILVKPNGNTKLSTIAQSENWDVREGDADNDVTVLQIGKNGDFSTAYAVLERIEDRLEHAFLLHTAIQRNGERVTAEEIRYMAQEIDTGMGGIYSILSREFQLPYIERRLHMLTRAGKLPKLPKEIVKPSVITGIEALGRGADRIKLKEFLKDMVDLFGPEEVARRLSMEETMTRFATAGGVNTTNLFKTEDQIAAEQQAAMGQGLMEKMAPEGLKQMGSVAQAAMVQNA